MVVDLKLPSFPNILCSKAKLSGPEAREEAAEQSTRLLFGHTPPNRLLEVEGEAALPAVPVL